MEFVVIRWKNWNHYYFFADVSTFVKASSRPIHFLFLCWKFIKDIYMLGTVQVSKYVYAECEASPIPKEFYIILTFHLLLDNKILIVDVFERD